MQYYEWLAALCLHVPLHIMCTPTYNIFIATLFTQRKISVNDKKMSAGLVQSSWCARFIFLCMNYVRYITKVPGKVSTATIATYYWDSALPHFPTFKNHRALCMARVSANPSISFAPMNCLVNEQNLGILVCRRSRMRSLGKNETWVKLPHNN